MEVERATKPEGSRELSGRLAGLRAGQSRSPAGFFRFSSATSPGNPDTGVTADHSSLHKDRRQLDHARRAENSLRFRDGAFQRTREKKLYRGERSRRERAAQDKDQNQELCIRLARSHTSCLELLPGTQVTSTAARRGTRVLRACPASPPVEPSTCSSTYTRLIAGSALLAFTPSPGAHRHLMATICCR